MLSTGLSTKCCVLSLEAQITLLMRPGVATFHGTQHHVVLVKLTTTYRAMRSHDALLLENWALGRGRPYLFYLAPDQCDRNSSFSDPIGIQIVFNGIREPTLMEM